MLEHQNNLKVSISLNKNVIIEESESGFKVVNNLGNYTIISYIHTIAIKIFKHLKLKPLSEQDLSSIFSDNFDEQALWYFYQNSLQNLGVLNFSFYYKDEKLFTINNKNSQYSFENNVELNEEQYISLSRFAYLKSIDGYMELNSPLSSIKFIIHNPQVLELMFILTTRSIKVKELLKLFFSKKVIYKILKELLIHNIIKNPIEELDTLKLWEFEDLLFHTHSRMGFQQKYFGATFKFAGKITQLPVYKKDPNLHYVNLPLKHNDIVTNSFEHVIKTRHSKREHDNNNPITILQLSHFLYSSAKIIKIDTSQKYYISSRPYPNGGACYELELYIIVNRCNGLESGLYHYNPLDHQLGKMQVDKMVSNQLLRNVTYTYGSTKLPQILICITARFGRVSWKYSSVAYSLCLKHVGILYQTMYLCATNIGIASCAIGVGDAYTFSLMTNTDCFAEPLIGEFIIGSNNKEN